MLGELSISGTFFSYTLEDIVRAPGVKVPGKTAIPAGRYQVVITPSKRFKRDMPLLLNVPGFEGIRIHRGSFASNTEGCILVGYKKQANMVFKSREAFDDLFKILKTAIDSKQDIFIEIG